MGDKNNQEQVQDINQLLKVRREKLAALQEAGKDPFTITKYDVTHHTDEAKALYEELEAKLLSGRTPVDTTGMDEQAAREAKKADYNERRAIMDANPSKHYYIRVSPEDMEDAMKEEEELKSIIDVKAELEIIEDATLSRGDCHVEMDSCVVDSGLGVRMEILKENLKLLVEEE